MAENILEALDDALAGGEPIDEIVGAFFQLARDADREVLDQMIDSLDERIGKYPLERVGSLALLAGALVERGADPRRFPRSVFDHALAQLESIEGPADPRELSEAFHQAERAIAAALGRSPELRRTLPQKPALAAKLKRYQERYGFLGKIVQVLDDEPLLVLHPKSRRGFRFRMSGIGDNFELHLRLLEQLAGEGPDRIPGIVPRGGSVTSDWQLANWSALRPGGELDTTDHGRTWIWNEGVPADIASFEGERVVLLGPSSIQRGWNAHAVFPWMNGALDDQRTLPSAEVDALLERMVRAGSA
ncbi:MAG: hypothetical protein KIT84_02890 [Labilithrix sp.]|nr:hypothetical protein [Labilithrix sp.]MCW5809928.1 hypothetical protein [Labilithrix sp.]